MSRIEITAPSSNAVLSDGILQTDLPLNGTLQVVKDQDNNSSTLSLATDETQVNSVLRIKTNSAELLDIEDSGSSNRLNINRDVQKINLDFASNPSGLTNQVGAIRTYQDEINLSDAMSFIKDGSIGIGTNAPLGLLHLKRSAATTRMVVDGDPSQSKIITYRTNGLQRFGLYTNNTPESGANVGSDFQIRAYNDAGALLSTPFFIKRSLGYVGINNTNPSNNLHVIGSTRLSNLLLGSVSNTAITATGTAATLQFANNGIGVAGSTPLTPAARFQIQGIGATSATTSLLVQNSAGTSAFTVRDDGTILIGNTMSGGNISTQFVTAGNLTLGNGNSRLYSFTQTNVNLCVNSTGVVVNSSNYSTSLASAILQANSTTQGFLPPRMTTAEKNAIAAPASGLVVYDTTLNKLCVFGVATWETIQSI